MPGAWTSYSLDDFLLFSPRVYWRLFELHNAEIWPAQVPALLLGAMVLALGLRPRPWGGPAVAFVLSGLWLWVGWSFLWDRYAAINWAVLYMVPAFAAEAVLLAGLAATGKMKTFGVERSVRKIAGMSLLSYGVLLHPFVAPISGRPIDAAELFGIAPDPTAIATLGVILMGTTARRYAGLLLVVPVFWCLISGLTLYALDAWESWIPFTAAGIAVLGGLSRR